MGTTVTTKGQVTIPKPIRDHLGIAPGSVMAFELADNGRVVLTKPEGPSPVSRFERARHGDVEDDDRRDHGAHARRPLR